VSPVTPVKALVLFPDFEVVGAPPIAV